jgi:AcrR family transcriptional regulator
MVSDQEKIMNEQKTDRRILGAARDLLASGGFGAVSFDTIAAEVGITKQAVLYWFPSKSDLLAAMFVDWLEAEAKVAEQCLQSVATADEAISVFVRAITRFHTDDLDRFRMMYLVPQTLKSGVQEARDTEVFDRIHVVTSRLYGALAKRLEGSPVEARQSAFAVHSAVLGLVMMLGLADGVGDPLAHSEQDLIEAMIGRLTS